MWNNKTTSHDVQDWYNHVDKKAIKRFDNIIILVRRKLRTILGPRGMGENQNKIRLNHVLLEIEGEDVVRK